MSLNLGSLVGRVAGLGLTVSNASALVSGVIALVETVESLYDDLKGSEKFEAVKAGARTLVQDLGLTDDFDKLWRGLGPLVSLVVSVYNLKNLWPKPAAPVAGAPG